MQKFSSLVTRGNKLMLLKHRRFQRLGNVARVYISGLSPFQGFSKFLKRSQCSNLSELHLAAVKVIRSGQKEMLKNNNSNSHFFPKTRGPSGYHEIGCRTFLRRKLRQAKWSEMGSVRSSPKILPIFQSLIHLILPIILKMFLNT